MTTATVAPGESVITTAVQDSSLTERRVTFEDSRPGFTPHIPISQSRKTSVAERRVELDREIQATAQAAKKTATEAAKAQATGRKASSRLVLANSNSQFAAAIMSPIFPPLEPERHLQSSAVQPMEASNEETRTTGAVALTAAMDNEIASASS